MDGNLADARAALGALLARYDHDNRVMIDQVYGQLSPTLDDFYDERLVIAFPKGPTESRAPLSLVTPRLTLTRVIPAGGPTRIAENEGAPFPLALVRAIVRDAARATDAGDSVRTLAARLLSGEAWVAPRQVGRLQRVVVRVFPGGANLTDVLASRD
jgi:hypothetical protein